MAQHEHIWAWFASRGRHFVDRSAAGRALQELALGAIAEGGEQVLNDDVVASLGVSPALIKALATREAGEDMEGHPLRRVTLPPTVHYHRLPGVVNEARAE